MSNALFEIFVAGIPQPAGSKKGFVVRNKATGKSRAIIVDDAKNSRPWKSHISAMVSDAWKAPPLDGALQLDIVFTMPRPASHFGTRKGERYLKPTAPHFHTVKPDRTKLLRCAEDALLGVLLVDDCRVVAGEAVKVYGEKPGASIRVSRATGEPTHE